MNLQGVLSTVTFQAMKAAEEKWPSVLAMLNQTWVSPATVWGIELRGTTRQIDKVEQLVVQAGGLVSGDENGAAAVFRYHGIF